MGLFANACKQCEFLFVLACLVHKTANTPLTMISFFHFFPGITVAPQLKSGSVLEALSGGKTSSPSASSNNNLSPGFLTAKTLKTSGSVMDVLGGANKSSTTSPFSSNTSSVFAGLQPATTLKTGSVMDILGKKTGKEQFKVHILFYLFKPNKLFFFYLTGAISSKLRLAE